jgi:uncharacterized protein (TIGR02271 family)
LQVPTYASSSDSFKTRPSTSVVAGFPNANTFAAFPASELGTQKNHNGEGVLMASTQTPRNQGVSSFSNRVIAYFNNKEDAYRAVNELQNAGFNSDEIGLIDTNDQNSGTATATSGHVGHTAEGHEGVWQKIKDFFSGESHDENDTDSSDYDYNESLEGMGWDQDRANYYYNGLNQGGALVSVSGSRADEGRRILQNAGGDLRESGFDYNQGTTGNENTGQISDTGERRIQLRGEVLRTYKERVQRGEVRLRKEVVTENQTVSVPVTREELVIERTPGSGQRATGEIGTDEEIRVPLSEERARVEKQPVVNEEVRVGKRAVQNTEQVSDNLRHEELRVDKDGNVDDVDTDVNRTSKRKKPAA